MAGGELPDVTPGLNRARLSSLTLSPSPDVGRVRAGTRHAHRMRWCYKSIGGRMPDELHVIFGGGRWASPRSYSLRTRRPGPDGETVGSRA